MFSNLSSWVYMEIMLILLREGGEGGDRGRDDWMASLSHGHEFEQTQRQ